MYKSSTLCIKKSPGLGLGLAPSHYPDFLHTRQPVDWLEIDTEPHMLPGGKTMAMLDGILEQYPVAMHGVSLSIGSTDGINGPYLNELKSLAQRIQPLWISDHLCWTGVQGKNTHELLPLPYTDKALKLVIRHISQVQDSLGQRILLENIASYVNFRSSEMSEWEFLRLVAEQADCLLLLDLNSIYRNSVYHHFDANKFLDHMPPERVQQIHLSSHMNHAAHLLDSSIESTLEPVWRLYHHACRRFGEAATTIAKNDTHPEATKMIADLNRARAISAEVSRALEATA